MTSNSADAPTGGRFFVLPTRRRRVRIDPGDIALPAREPRPPAIALVGITQATGVLAFDFHAERGGAHR